VNSIHRMMRFAFVSKRSARSLVSPGCAVLMIFSLAGLINVTSVAQLFAQQSAPSVTAEKATVAAKDDDKDDGKGDDGDDDDDDQKALQSVRVGDLIGRAVIAPVESQDLLGHVAKVVRTGDDEVTIVASYGGHLGFGTHLVCVPADALALTGYALQAKGISVAELDKLPVCDGNGGTPLEANASIKMKLAKPAH
jgi:hypothetical protein